jgi:hypothetical protein
MRFVFGLGAAAIISGIVWSIPVIVPDGIRHTIGMAPHASAYVPYVHTEAKRLRHTIAEFFYSAPDVVHTMAIGIALDPDYPVSRVVKLDTDLLIEPYLSGYQRMLGGVTVATHSSILSVAVMSGRLDIAKAILLKAGVDNSEAERIALQSGRSFGRDSEDIARQYLDLYAALGGRKDISQSDGVTLTELLRPHAPEVLHAFKQKDDNRRADLRNGAHDLANQRFAEVAPEIAQEANRH